MHLGLSGNNDRMDDLEPIRRGYHALGLGADRDVLAMLDQDGPGPACWEIHRFGLWGRRRPAGEVAALALFGPTPPGYELAGVQIATWDPDDRTGRLVVDGRFRLRRHGSWDSIELPFSHVWSFKDGRVDSVFNVIQTFEVRRLADAACASAQAV
jgi:ketosteroid isomerase-like protein